MTPTCSGSKGTWLEQYLIWIRGLVDETRCPESRIPSSPEQPDHTCTMYTIQQVCYHHIVPKTNVGAFLVCDTSNMHGE